jgi:hypothetical protein
LRRRSVRQCRYRGDCRCLHRFRCKIQLLKPTRSPPHG